MFKGYTFDNQNVSSKTDGGFYTAVLSDGVIWGCEVSNTNSAVTFQPGLLIIGGRLIGIDGATTVDAEGMLQNGYGQVVLTIDLSQPATDDTFSQVEVSIVYSATTTFPELTQGDINNDENVYQKELAVFEIVGGNINSIMSQIGVSTHAGVLPVTNGGTGASTPEEARTNLGLAGYHPYENISDIDILEYAESVAAGITVIGLGNNISNVPTFGGNMWNYCTGYILRRSDVIDILLYGRNSMTAVNHAATGPGWTGWRCLVDSPNERLQINRGGTGGITNLINGLSFQNGWSFDGVGVLFKLGKAVFFHLPIRNGTTTANTTILTGMPATNGSVYWYRCLGPGGGAVALNSSGILTVHEAMSAASVTIDGIYIAAAE